MKSIYAFIICFAFACSSFAQSGNISYDKVLADSLGADEYGMKHYIFVILKTGSNTTETKERSDSLFREHLNNIGLLASVGKLVVAGPFVKNDKSYRGLFILNAGSIEEANVLLSTDAAIAAHLLEPELYTWYGSAALPMYLDFHSKIQKAEH